jgi:hypothetical protein
MTDRNENVIASLFAHLEDPQRTRKSNGLLFIHIEKEEKKKGRKK